MGDLVHLDEVIFFVLQTSGKAVTIYVVIS